MPQIKKSYSELTVPLTKMSFTPDVPSAALTSNEYNIGINVETDVRGIRSVSGDAEILSNAPGIPTFITGGFRNAGEFWFIMANQEGEWWASNGAGGWTNITPPAPYDGSVYSQNTNISEAWNGTVVIFNDGTNPPFFLQDGVITNLVNYKNNIAPQSISNIVVGVTTATITVQDDYNLSIGSSPFSAGDQILITNVNNYYNGIYTVVSSEVLSATETEIVYTAQPGSAYPGGGTVSAAYTWNYNPNWKSLSAGFMRIYSTPNVGNILVAGNLTATDLDNVVTNFPVSVVWSQAFGLNQAPLTWEPTVLNVANQLEVPLRGTLLDAYPANGNLYLGSYWDTVVFTPMNYSTTSAPILGVRLFNQGRGLLNTNCWANTDDMVYGIDARDIWAFNGQTFTGIGNQRVRHWFFDQLNQDYISRVYMETNTEKNQIEIYFPDHNAATEGPSAGVPNKMISYRYDLDCWNAPRDVSLATFACESPVWSEASPGVWTFNPASRTIVYAKGAEDVPIVMKDQGYEFINGLPINSTFRRDNIKLVKDYSSKILVHRVLPEIVNLNDNNVQINPVVNPELVGAVAATVEGANSVGQEPQFVQEQTLMSNTDYPWVQINQNAHRVNSIELSSDTVNTPGTIWMCTALTFQFTETEDDR
jgi:hypothetical protein